ncbi:type IV secretion system protein VirD4 [Pseudoduganella lurida]|uniref:Type IV secretion system protein VirD4 n=1 Tax=Pseudoduganella lurida TaxID=1036180 RepID=A0A562R1S7_9BURK|nr:type IV secretory system conjugative DNA transfer family protein [Pseudoduganella lurida]TWI62544.1 type IV secretion system protein VirD4 [Pseudoduganella lurida]
MKQRFNNAVGPQVRRPPRRRHQIIPVLAAGSLAAGLQAATQFFAHTFRYQPVLGEQLHSLYAPWGILRWAGRWYAQYPDEFLRAGSVGISVTGVGLIMLVVARMVLSNSVKVNEFLHGSARWANIRDIRAAGLLPRSTLWQRISGNGPVPHAGVYVGAWQDPKGALHYLRHDGPEHVLTYAPTRSGKGVGLVVPTLLSWSSSTVVTDLKGELWALTAGWRQQHARNRTLRFEPAAAAGSVRWNPLDEIRVATEYEVGDVQNLATLIVDPDGKGLETHWQKTSQALIVGVILHALYKAREEGIPASLPAVDAMMSVPDRAIGELWMEMITYRHADGKNHPVIGSAARDMLDRPEEEAGSVLSTAKSYLALYRDPIVARNVGASEFRIRDLMHHDSPVSLYIVTQPNDKSRLRPLVRVMVNMIVRQLADRMAFSGGRAVAHYKHRLLMMLDEFPSLGRLDIMQESLGFLAGYGIKCYLVCQDINQLKSRETGYGHDESITSACHIQNAYPPNRLETAEHLSKLTGQTTVAKEQITTSGRRTSALLGQVSRTIQETQRPLLTTDECLRMPGPVKDANGDITKAGDMVIYAAGHPAIYGKQPLYFQDPVFLARAAIPAPLESDRLIHLYEGERIKL